MERLDSPVIHEERNEMKRKTYRLTERKEKKRKKRKACREREKERERERERAADKGMKSYSTNVKVHSVRSDMLLYIYFPSS